MLLIIVPNIRLPGVQILGLTGLFEGMHGLMLRGPRNSRPVDVTKLEFCRWRCSPLTSH
jgi:hypothetical protein